MMPLPEAVLFQFDDAAASVYERAFPILQAAGFPATAYAATVWMNAANWVNVAQYQEMYAAGWDVGCHTTNHVDLTELTQAQQEAEIDDNATYIESLGMPRGARHVAYPMGLYNADTLAACTAVGMKTGRTVSPADQLVPVAAPYEIKGVHNLYTTSMPLADAIAKVHPITTPNRIVVYLCHGLTDEGSESKYAEADFAALVAAVKASGVRVVTISQLYDYIQAGYVWPE